MANYIREWNNMARCYNPFGCPFKAAHQGTTERRCTLEEDCVSKDKKATYNYVKKNEGYVVLNERQRAEQAASMTGHELDQKIETAKQLLNQLEELGKEFDLKETIKEVHKCIDIYTKERDQPTQGGWHLERMGSLIFKKENRTWQNQENTSQASEATDAPRNESGSPLTASWRIG